MTDIPAVCDTCLGSDYIEMKRLLNGAECKICTLPFTVFKWKSNNSLHKTVICLTCSRSKNCCQSCLNDLTFGIDIHTRDKLFKLAKIDNQIKLSNTTSKIYNANILNEKYKSEEITHLHDNNEKLSLIQSKLDSLPENFTLKLKKLPFKGNLSINNNNSFKYFFLFGFQNLDKSSIAIFFNLPQSSIHLNNTARLAFIEFPNHNKAVEFAKQFNSPNKPALIIIDNIPLRISWAQSIIEFSPQESSKIANIVSKQMAKLSKDELRAKNLTSAKIHK